MIKSQRCDVADALTKRIVQPRDRSTDQVGATILNGGQVVFEPYDGESLAANVEPRGQSRAKRHETTPLFLCSRAQDMERH
jgi:hypothetical protein